MTARRRAPRLMMPAFEALRDELAPTTRLASVQRVWVEEVGAAIADAATPVSERAGVLTVACSASVWAQELDLMGEEILAKLNRRLPQTGLVRLRCVTGSAPGRTDTG